MTKIIKVKVPATTANLGPGFDTLSLALNWFNEFTFKIIDDGLKINQFGNKSIPEDSSNLVYKSFCEVYRKFKLIPPGVEIEINSIIPLAAGLGSSATAVIAGLTAANSFIGNKLSNSEILSMATKLEGHPDNCAAAIFGGLTVSVSIDEEVYVNPFPWPKDLLVVVLHPDFDLPTRISRELLPPKVPFGDAVFNVSRTAFLLSSLLNKDFNLVRLGFQDRLHQQYRKDLVPGMEVVLKEALKYGACGATLSGAGPTLVAFVNEKNKAEDIGNKMKEKWLEFKVNSTYKILEVSYEGIKIENLTGVTSS